MENQIATPTPPAAGDHTAWARIRRDWEGSQISLGRLATHDGIASETTVRRKRDNPRDPWRRPDGLSSPALLPVKVTPRRASPSATTAATS